MVIFHACDMNGDGVLSPLELSTRLSDFGMNDDQVQNETMQPPYSIFAGTCRQSCAFDRPLKDSDASISPPDDRSTSSSSFSTRMETASSTKRNS